MKKNFFLLMVMIMFLFLGTSCTTYHFGVADRASGVPTAFDQTETAIAQAERSPGAKYCPEKIAKAKELAKKGAETYWACRTDEAMDLLEEARKLAKEAEGCRPSSPPPKPAPAPKVIDKMTLQVFFDFDKDILTEADLKELPKAVAFVKKYPGAKIRLDGYTDNIGTDEYNIKLSGRRVTAVKNHLIKEAGVSSSKITAVGHGAANPVADNKTAEGRAKNRRVEISILSD